MNDGGERASVQPGELNPCRGCTHTDAGRCERVQLRWQVHDLVSKKKTAHSELSPFISGPIFFSFYVPACVYIFQRSSSRAFTWHPTTVLLFAALRL